MQAIILAAGMGKRLGELTAGNTKCMVKVNGVTIIERALRQLDELNLSRVVIVVGYKGQALIDFIGTLNVRTPIVFIDNPDYNKTNNIYSLYLAKDYMIAEDTLLLESDLIFEEGILKDLVEDPHDTAVLVDKYASWMDGTCVTLTPDGWIDRFISKKLFEYSDIAKYYKTVNIYKFGRAFSENYYVPFLEAYSKALGCNEYYEQVLRVIALLDTAKIWAKCLNGQRWYEIDDVQDLDIASSMFADDDTRLAAVQGRFGGYWRYPNMTDFCYLVNPHFPPKKMLDEMQASFTELLTQYPSGMRVNSLVAARNFYVHLEHIVIGNGAAELIKSVMERMEGRVGYIRPTFEEYPNRGRCESVVYTPQDPDLRYTVDDLMAYFGQNKVNALVVINPDNPSGNYLPKADVMRLAAWCEAENIRLIYDESFADFADEEDHTMLTEALMARYPHMLVVKSISKSYGVPGARLGVLASADEALISNIKKDVAIWNINSFGEFFMQIEEKYHKDYLASLKSVREDRTFLTEGLASIPGLRVIPSQANYLLVELPAGVCATTLTRDLLVRDNLLIKDLSRKIRLGERQFIRVAVRDRADNQKLIDAMRIALSANS